MSTFGKGNLGEAPQPVPASNPTADNISRRGHNYRLWFSLFASAVFGAMILTVVVIARDKQESEKGTSVIVPEVSPTVSVNLEAAGNSCPEGYWLSDNEFYSLCVPEGFNEEINITESFRYPGSNDILATYTKDQLRLYVTSGFQGGWGGDYCTFFGSVDGMKSMYFYLQSDAMCEVIMPAYEVLVGVGEENYPFPYHLNMTAPDGQYPDGDYFTNIVNTLKIKG